jgi:hypothetical protein
MPDAEEDLEDAPLLAAPGTSPTDTETRVRFTSGPHAVQGAAAGTGGRREERREDEDDDGGPTTRTLDPNIILGQNKITHGVSFTMEGAL